MPRKQINASQSLVDPRVGTASSAPDYKSTEEALVSGWHPESIGWSDDGERSKGRDPR